MEDSKQMKQEVDGEWEKEITKKKYNIMICTFS